MTKPRPLQPNKGFPRRPFVISGVHDMTAEGLSKLGLDAPDENGVHRYLNLSEETPAGVEEALKYSEDLAEVTDDVRTPVRNWRRIGVLRFARLD